MSIKRRALGKGLNSLMQIEDENNGLTTISIDSIIPNPFQPRIDFNEEAINDLANSIEKQGLLQPIVIRKKNNNYEIISGERRYRAFKILNKTKIPAIIKNNVDDTKMLELAIVENIQRENLNIIETAISYQKLISECNFSHQKLSDQIGKSRSNITNTLRLLKLPNYIQKLVRNNKISMGHARALLSIGGDEKKQKILADKIIKTGMSVRELEKNISIDSYIPPIIKKETDGKPQNKKIFKSIENQWNKKFGLNFKLRGNSDDKGKIEILYSNKIEFDKILELFNKKVDINE